MASLTPRLLGDAATATQSRGRFEHHQRNPPLKLLGARATGTFSFVAGALKSTDAIGTKTVTAGTVDVKL